jgi:hypothetical protein
MFRLATFCILAGVALSIPTQTTSAVELAYTHASTFTLISEEFTIGDGIGYIGNWSLEGYHTGAGLDTAVLVSPQTGNGRQFWSNGTKAEIKSNHSNILTSGGTPPFPFGLVIPSAEDSVNDPLGRRVQVNAGQGTQGVHIGWINTPADPYPVPYLEYANKEPGPGQFYACNTTYFPGQPSVPVVFWRNASASTPEQCAEIRLYPQCDGAFTDGLSRPYAVKSKCFESVNSWETS